MTNAASPTRYTPRGLALRIRLTPKSSADRIDGVTITRDGPAIQARVRSVPADNEANKALESLIVSWLGVPKSCVALTAGQKSRIKTIEVTGDAALLEVLIAEKLSILQS